MAKRFRVVVADFITELKPELAILNDIAEIVAFDAASDDQEIYHRLQDTLFQQIGDSARGGKRDLKSSVRRILHGTNIASRALQAQGFQIRHAAPDIVLSPAGGGGMIAGCATALTALLPGVKIYAVDPAGFDDTARSLAANKRVGNEPGKTTICDALMAPMPGELTFAINGRLLAGGFAVSDQEVQAAMAYAFRVLKLVVEPGGA